MKTKPKIIHVAAALNAIFVFSRNTGPHFVLDRKHGLHAPKAESQTQPRPGRIFSLYCEEGKKEALEHFKHMINICPSRGHIFQNKLWNTWTALLAYFSRAYL